MTIPGNLALVIRHGFRISRGVEFLPTILRIDTIDTIPTIIKIVKIVKSIITATIATINP